MGWLLGRPRRINADDCDADIPLGFIPSTLFGTTSSSRFEDGSEPFSFSSNLYQYAIAQVIHNMRSAGADKASVVDYNVVWMFHEQVLSLVKQLPDVLRPDNPDTSWDERISYLPKQRDLVWSMANAVLMILHRPHLARHNESRQVVVDCALTVLDSHQCLFEKTCKHLYKMFSLTFYTIDAAIMLSAVTVMYPTEEPKAEKIVEDALKTALVRLKLMEASNPTAEAGAQVVQKCYEKFQDAKRFSVPEPRGLIFQRASMLPHSTGHGDMSCSTLDPSWNHSHLNETYSVAMFDYSTSNTFDASFWLEQLTQVPDLIIDNSKSK